jgi:hypothetical protein
MIYSFDRSLTIAIYSYSFAKHTITHLFMNLSYDICFVSCMYRYKYRAYERNKERKPISKRWKETKLSEVQNWFLVPATFVHLIIVIISTVYTYFFKLTHTVLLEYK